MTVICNKNLCDNEIINNILGDYKNEDTILSDSNKNMNNSKLLIKEKRFSSMKNIKRNNNFIIKSKTEKFKNKINLPQLNIKKKFQIKSS